jgi:hypothetical protein
MITRDVVNMVQLKKPDTLIHLVLACELNCPMQFDKNWNNIVEISVRINELSCVNTTTLRLVNVGGRHRKERGEYASVTSDVVHSVHLCKQHQIARGNMKVLVTNLLK